MTAVPTASMLSRLLIALVLAQPAAAQEEAAGDGERSGSEGWVLEERVVVTASRVEEGLDEVPVSVTLLDEAELASSSSLTVDDRLRQVPGFSLFRRSSSLVAHPTTQGLSLRGIGPSGVSRTLVLIDGLPLNDPFGGWVYWSRIPRDTLGRAEIVRGGSSSVWGNYALAGVVQLLTSRPEGDRVSLRADAGERDTVGLEGSWSRPFPAAVLTLQGHDFETGGYPVVRPDQRGVIDVPASSEHAALNGGVRFSIGASAEIKVHAGVFDEERGNGTPLTGNDTQASRWGVAGSRTGTAGTFALSLFLDDQDFASTFSAQDEDRSSERLALDQFLVDAEAVGFSAQWTRAWGSGRSGHTLTAGTDVRLIEGETNEDFRNLGAGFTRRRRAGGEQQLGGVYLQENYASGGRWRWSLGARVDRWRSLDGRRREDSLTDGTPVRDDTFGDRAETELSPKVALHFAATDELSLQASLYRAFRAPTINELFRPFRVRNDITEANSELLPEVLMGAEVGLRYLRGETRSRLNLFWNEVNDPIANVTLSFGPGVRAPCGFVPGGGSCRQRQNLDQTRIAGLEAEVGYRPKSSPWSLSASYLLSDPEVVRAPSQPGLEGKRLAQVPRHQLVLRADLTGGPLSGAVLGRYASEQFDDDLNRRELDDFVVVELHVFKELGDRWRLSAAVENLFDEEIESARTASGLVTLAAPRLVHLGVRYRWTGQ